MSRRPQIDIDRRQVLNYDRLSNVEHRQQYLEGPSSLQIESSVFNRFYHTSTCEGRDLYPSFSSKQLYHTSETDYDPRPPPFDWRARRSSEPLPPAHFPINSSKADQYFDVSNRKTYQQNMKRNQNRSHSDHNHIPTAAGMGLSSFAAAARSAVGLEREDVLTPEFDTTETSHAVLRSQAKKILEVFF